MKLICYKNALRILMLHVMALLIITTGCERSKDTSGQYYYTEDDFNSVQKTDIHVHINGNEQAFIGQALSDNFRVLTINTDCSEFAPFRQQRTLAASLKKRYPKSVVFAGTFKVDSYTAQNWENNAMAQIDSAIDQGAAAIKIWKNIGMADKDKNGKLIMPDDPMFDTIYDHLEEKHIPLFIHVGEPKNCWLPVEQMTVSNDKIYFKNHPEYYMYLHPDFPDYQKYIDARDNVLNEHRNLQVIGCHMGSLEWSVGELAKRLDKYPNFSVDMAARMGQVQFQCISEREKVRNFFLKYQDRILYGTDINTAADSDPKEVRRNLHEAWIADWKFLCSDETMTSVYVDRPFEGLKLPKTVLDKIYNLNAARYFSYSK